MREVREEERKIIFWGLFLLDRISKFFALKWGWAIINKGASWNFFPSFLTNVVFLILNSLFLILLFPFRKRWGVGLMIVGGMANLLDRLVYGGVVDFISLPLVPAFNLADIAICFGGFLLFIDLLKIKPV